MNYTVLITGCSTGIGRALAEEFHRLGHIVYASARRPETLQPLAAQGIRTVALDVNDDTSIEALKTLLASENVTLDVLVNNAGYGAMGPLVEMPMSELRLQFDTNFFSLVALTQALLPSLLASSEARIINISSVSGIAPTPFAGAYCASKAAVNAMSDALRMELSPFNIKVITVQPGGIRSEFGNTASKSAGHFHSESSLYASTSNAILSRATASQVKAMSADVFARRLVAEVLVKNPAPIIRLGHLSTLMPLLKRWLPTAVFDRILSRRFGLSRKERLVNHSPHEAH